MTCFRTDSECPTPKFCAEKGSCQVVPRVVQLQPGPKASDEIKAGIIRMLEQALAEARAGEYSGLIIITKDLYNGWENSMSGIEDFSTAIGMLEITKLQWWEKYETARRKQKD